VQADNDLAGAEKRRLSEKKKAEFALNEAEAREKIQVAIKQLQQFDEEVSTRSYELRAKRSNFFFLLFFFYLLLFFFARSIRSLGLRLRNYAVVALSQHNYHAEHRAVPF